MSSCFSCSVAVMSDSLRPWELQHTRLPCPSLSPEFAQTHVHWVSDAIQPSHPVTRFSSSPQAFPASMSFPMSLTLRRKLKVENSIHLKLYSWCLWRFPETGSLSTFVNLERDCLSYEPLRWECKFVSAVYPSFFWKIWIFQGQVVSILKWV